MSKYCTFQVTIPYDEDHLPYACLLSKIKRNLTLAEFLWTGICSEDIDMRNPSILESKPDDTPLISVSCLFQYTQPSQKKYILSTIQRVVIDMIPDLTPEQRGHLFCVGVDAFGGVDKVYSLINATKPTTNELPSGVRLINADSNKKSGKPNSETGGADTLSSNQSTATLTVDDRPVQPNIGVATQANPSFENEIFNVDYTTATPDQVDTSVVPAVNQTNAHQPVEVESLSRTPQPESNGTHNDSVSSAPNVEFHQDNSAQSDKPHINLGNTQNTPNISGNIDFNEHAGQSGSREPISFLKGKFPI